MVGYLANNSLFMNCLAECSQPVIIRQAGSSPGRMTHGILFKGDPNQHRDLVLNTNNFVSSLKHFLLNIKMLQSHCNEIIWELLQSCQDSLCPLRGTLFTSLNNPQGIPFNVMSYFGASIHGNLLNVLSRSFEILQRNYYGSSTTFN